MKAIVDLSDDSDWNEAPRLFPGTHSIAVLFINSDLVNPVPGKTPVETGLHHILTFLLNLSERTKETVNLIDVYSDLSFSEVRVLFNSFATEPPSHPFFLFFLSMQRQLRYILQLQDALDGFEALHAFYWHSHTYTHTYPGRERSNPRVETEVSPDRLPSLDVMFSSA